MRASRHALSDVPPPRYATRPPPPPRGAREENVPERRREDAIGDAPLLHIGQPRLEDGQRLRHRVGGRARAQAARGVIDGAIAVELLAARRARVDVTVNALGGGRLRLT